MGLRYRDGRGPHMLTEEAPQLALADPEPIRERADIAVVECSGLD
jgi:hypothetical protein